MEKMGENISEIERLNFHIERLYRVIQKDADKITDLRKDCNHEVLVCLDEGDILDDVDPVIYCLNCAMQYGSHTTLFKTRGEKIIFVDKKNKIFEYMTNTQIVKQVADYYNSIAESNPELTTSEIVDYINESMIEDIKKKRTLEQKNNN